MHAIPIFVNVPNKVSNEKKVGKREVFTIRTAHGIISTEKKKLIQITYLTKRTKVLEHHLKYKSKQHKMNKEK